MVKLEKVIISTLKDSGELTLSEIASKIGESDKKVFKELRKLFAKGLITSENRHYKIV